MDKIKKQIKPLVNALVLVLIILCLLFILVGFIAFIVNIVCLKETSVFQRLAFLLFVIIGVGISWFCFDGKEQK